MSDAAALLSVLAVALVAGALFVIALMRMRRKEKRDPPGMVRYRD
tara:strand:+ start:2520 stop:2654 length:135 start_codon:yes stop_codon:yes gene_type:complete